MIDKVYQEAIEALMARGRSRPEAVNILGIITNSKESPKYCEHATDLEGEIRKLQAENRDLKKRLRSLFSRDRDIISVNLGFVILDPGRQETAEQYVRRFKDYWFGG